MDGGRRLLRSVSGASATLQPSAPTRALLLPSFADAAAALWPVPRRASVPSSAKTAKAIARRRFFEQRRRSTGWLVSAPRRGVGVLLAGVVLGATGLYGTVRGGHFDAFVAGQSEMADWLACELGFAITDVTISGHRRLSEQEILTAAGITPQSSLAFLNAAGVRDKIAGMPLVQEATVGKFFPNRLSIGIVEREPYALWQKEGDVFVIASDGTIIDSRRDPRFDGLPFVVGEGANLRAAEFVRVLDAAGDLRGKIRAGTLVAGRRWNLTMTAGMVVKLPEIDPQTAVTQLAVLQRDEHVIDRDVLSLDMRLAGRMVARLSEEATYVRTEALAHRTAKPRGGHG
jgi:cell division protein FtsQ